jgi:glucose-6-phosphate isomerase
MLSLGGCAGVQAQIESLVAASAADRIWKRDAGFWGGDAARRESVANRLGWLDVAQQMRADAGALQAFAERICADGFLDAVVLGMGGSSLAPEVMRRSFGVRRGWPRLHVLDTTDPATIRAVLEQIDPARTLFFVSSKSGTTIEALSLFAFFHEQVRAAKPDDAGANFVAITDAGTPLQDLATQHGFRHVFVNPGDIGGRYSALSYFGLAPAAVMGVDVGRLLDRGIAAAADARAAESDALRLGAALGALALAGWDKATFIVSPGIGSFGLWVEQLIAESTGKEGRGILPVADEDAASPNGYGDDRVFVRLRLGADTNGSEDAVVGSLLAAGLPVVSIDLDDVYDLGREFFRWEFAVAVAGQVLGINPFDEPNVQESKDNTNRVLAEFERTGSFGAIDEVAVRAGQLRAKLAGLMSSLNESNYFAITAYVQPSERAGEQFRRMRSAVRRGTGVATTLGYGPRYLHSTGQLHKGGPACGVFLQVTAHEGPDLAIPGRSFTFGQLKRAQAIGDLQSLHSHGLPALSVRLSEMNAEADLEYLCGIVREAIAPAGARR